MKTLQKNKHPKRGGSMGNADQMSVTNMYVFNK